MGYTELLECARTTTFDPLDIFNTCKKDFSQPFEVRSARASG